jgi:hypothetical protein
MTHRQQITIPESTSSFTSNFTIVEPQPKPGRVIVITNSLHVSLLATCQLIYEEALPFLQQKMQSMIDRPPRMIIETNSAPILLRPGSFLRTMVSQIYSMIASIDHGTHLIPRLNGPNLQHRLSSKHFWWTPYLSARDFSAMASFIHHAGFYFH